MTHHIEDPKLISAELLRSDGVASDIGIWQINTHINDKPTRFIIARDARTEQYTLAIANPLEILGYGDSLEEIAGKYNGYVTRSHKLHKTHKVTHKVMVAV